MQILYIDVYFLINFTVDLLALYLAALLSKVKGSVSGLIIASAIGAAFASAVALFSIKGLYFLLALLVSVTLGVFVFAKSASLYRKLKLTCFYLITETLIGGSVTFLYNIMDKYFYPLLKNESFDPANRRLLILALLVLLGYSFLRLVYLVFRGSEREENCEISFYIDGKNEKTDALIDSGSLLLDPFDSSPVIIVKSSIFKRNPIEDKENNEEIKKRIRVIPTKSIGGERLLMGIKCDLVTVDGRLKIENVVIAIDNEEGSFGGYMALVPSLMLE